nr:tyrosine-type recombinase/integrase [uncultured Desulfobulbus sp.]
MNVQPFKDLDDIARLRKHLSDHPRNYALFVIGINCGLRFSDLIRLKVSDVKNRAVGDHFTIQEQKTGKRRAVVINTTMHDAIEKLLAANPTYHADEPIFQGTNRGKALTYQSGYALIKQWAEWLGLQGNFGTHTLRKTFVYGQRKHGGAPLEILQKALNHRNMRETLRYACIDDTEVLELPMKYEL